MTGSFCGCPLFLQIIVSFYPSYPMLSSDKHVATLTELIAQLKVYIELKKDYLKADLVEKIVRLTTALAVAVTLLILTVAVMFYLTLALVHWMAPVTGLAAAFGIVGLALLALLILVVLFRKAWIERPLVRVLAEILLEEDTH